MFRLILSRFGPGNLDLLHHFFSGFTEILFRGFARLFRGNTGRSGLYRSASGIGALGLLIDFFTGSGFFILEGRDLQLEKAIESAPLVRMLVASGAQIEEVTKSQSSLEQIFLTLVNEHKKLGEQDDAN